MTDQLEYRLLDFLSRRLASPSLSYVEAPTQLQGGFESLIYSVALAGAPGEFSGPLILRVLRRLQEPARARREAVVHNTIHELGFPAPRVLLAVTSTEALGAPFLIMQRVAGRTLAAEFEGLGRGRSMGETLLILLRTPQILSSAIALMAESSVAVPRVWKGFAWAATVILLLNHVIAAPFLGLTRIAYQANVNSRLDRAMASVPSDPQLASQDLVLINPADHVYLVGEIWAVKRLANSPMPRHIRELSTGGTLEVTRVGPRSLQVRFPAGFFSNDFSRYLRNPNERFSAGQHFELPGLSVTVESIDKHGDPAEVLYEFPVALEDFSLRWIRWHDGVYVPWTPPVLGQTQTFSPQRGIF